MKKAEIILVTLAVTGFILSLFLIPGGNTLKILSLGFLSLLYFYLGFALFNGVKFRNIFSKSSYKGISTPRILGAIGIGITLSILVIGILFKIMSWAGASMMLIIGLIISTMVTIAAIIKFSTEKSSYYSNILKRALPFTIAGLLMFFIPGITWIELQYRNHPTYIEAFRNATNDPDNELLWQKVQEEQEKIDMAEEN